jgi:cell division septum initiation protein DivIVA
VSEYECTEHLFDEIQRLRESNFQLREGAEELKQRIKQLEEAGDELEYASVISEAGEDPNGFEKLLIAQRKWNKSKEAKP